MVKEFSKNKAEIGLGLAGNRKTVEQSQAKIRSVKGCGIGGSAKCGQDSRCMSPGKRSVNFA